MNNQTPLEPGQPKPEIQPKSVQPEATQSKPKSKKKIITIVIFLIILIAAGYLVGIEINDWWQARKEYIKMGYASDKFPFRMYTEKELVEMGKWPVESPSLINTPTRRTPEETYNKFRQALIDGNFEVATRYFIEEQRSDWLESLREIKGKGYLSEMLDDLPERLEDTYGYEQRAKVDLNTTALMSYDYIVFKEGEEKGYSHVISFVKDWNGDWLIEDL